MSLCVQQINTDTQSLVLVMTHTAEELKSLYSKLLIFSHDLNEQVWYKSKWETEDGFLGQNKCQFRSYPVRSACWTEVDVWGESIKQAACRNTSFASLPASSQIFLESKILITRFNFALHFLLFNYHSKERLSTISCFSLRHLFFFFLTSWMSFKTIYIDKNIDVCKYIHYRVCRTFLWTLIFIYMMLEKGEW